MLISELKSQLHDIFTDNSSVYLYGKPGLGKSKLIHEFVKKEKYEHIYTDIQSLKNDDDFIELLKQNHIMNMFNVKKRDSKKKIIIIDNLDYLNNHDKKVISTIIKYLKSINDKKVSKGNCLFQNKNLQKNVCIVFIGNNNTDKKNLELQLISELYIHLVEDEADSKDCFHDPNIKEIVKSLVNCNYDHLMGMMNEKTIISLCYHENIVHYINNDISLYLDILKNICYGDLYDRIAFQNQLWQFNEMTYFIKTISNYHKCCDIGHMVHSDRDIVFTKILTKYSNEYSNSNFIIGICSANNLSKDELYYWFYDNEYSNLHDLNDIEELNSGIYSTYKNRLDSLTTTEKKRINKIIL